GARAHDRARNAPRVALLAVGADHLGEFGFVGGVHPIGSRAAVARIHTHVERTGLAKTEAAARLVELRRRHAEIEEQRRDAAGKTVAVAGCAQAREAQLLDYDARV